ncbi:MAG: hypothetical protein E7168_00890 [Firmicutes bacterium]|nr:hypothetical protein [Bacillota bacterium]
MAKYEGQCGSCDNFFDQRGNCDKPYDTNSSELEQGYCDWYECYYYPNDHCDRHYKKRGWRSTSPCYITTIVCDILGFGDNCGDLNTLRNLRNHILQKDEKYAKILYEYDVVGPQIAQKISDDYKRTEDKELATLLFNFYIQSSARLYREGHVEESIERYQEMTTSLAETFGIETPIEVDPNYDYEKGGHGQVKMKKLGSYFDVL